MRYINIDLSSDNYLQQPQIFGGYAGEHNETVLQVTLPQRMMGVEYSDYRFDFQTSEDNEIPVPVSKLENGILSCHLTEQLTIAGKLLFNIVARKLDGKTVSLTSKTNMVNLYIGDSADGNSVLPDPAGYKDEILEMIDARILEINPANVEQTYNSESENAQSGKALRPVFQKKIELWQPNTEYKFGDMVLANIQEYGTILTVGMFCIRNHTAGDIHFPSDMQNFYEYWDTYTLCTHQSLRALEDDDGNLIHETYATKDELAEAIGEALEGNY